MQIVSKGYILAFSIHRPTFVFNTACAVFDVVGCFAAFVFVFSSYRRDTGFWHEMCVVAEEPDRLSSFNIVMLNLYRSWAQTFIWTVGGVAWFCLATVRVFFFFVVVQRCERLFSKEDARTDPPPPR